MAVGRVGCLLTERPGTPTGTSLGHHPGCRGGRAARRPPAGVPLHPSFAYEIAFHARRLRRPVVLAASPRLPPGATFVLYVAAYGVFRFLVEFVRGNEVVWHGLTRPQLFLAVTVPIVLAARRAAPATA